MRPKSATLGSTQGKALSNSEDFLMFQISRCNLPIPEREYPFAAAAVGRGPGIKERLQRARLRNWRFDFAWPGKSFAVEVEGGAYSQGRHTRGKGFSNDLRKYHYALRLGWIVYRCDPDMVRSGLALEMIEDFLKQAWHNQFAEDKPKIQTMENSTI